MTIATSSAEFAARIAASTVDHSTSVLCNDPPVVLIEDYLAQPERQALIDAARLNLGVPKLDVGQIGADYEVRSGRLAWLPHFHNATTQALADRIAALVGIPLDHAESFQVVRYGVGHQYRAHYDGYDMTTRVGASNVARGGQRIATALLYLVAPEEGGGTPFPNLDIEVEPVPGRLLVFWNVGQDRLCPHPATLHAGAPVGRGEKWIANLWFRERPYRAD